MTLNISGLGRVLAIVTIGFALSSSAASAQKYEPVLLYEEEMVTFISEPEAHLVAAREALAEGDRAGAIDGVRAAAIYTGIEARTAKGTTKADLTEASKDLNKLATAIGNGHVRTAQDFDNSLGRTYRALAVHHLARARTAWERREFAAAGNELRGAGRYTEHLAGSMGKDVERGAQVVVRDARVVSGKLTKGVGWTSDEVGKVFDALGTSLEKLGGRMEPRRR